MLSSAIPLVSGIGITRKPPRKPPDKIKNSNQTRRRFFWILFYWIHQERSGFVFASCNNIDESVWHDSSKSQAGNLGNGGNCERHKIINADIEQIIPKESSLALLKTQGMHIPKELFLALLKAQGNQHPYPPSCVLKVSGKQNQFPSESSHASTKAGIQHPSEPSLALWKAQGNLCPSEPSRTVLKAQGNQFRSEPSHASTKAGIQSPNEPSRKLLKAGNLSPNEPSRKLLKAGNQAPEEPSVELLKAGNENPNDPFLELLKAGIKIPNEPSHELLKAHGNQDPMYPSLALEKAPGIRNEPSYDFKKAQGSERFLARDQPVNNLWNQDIEGDVSHFCDPGNHFNNHASFQEREPPNLGEKQNNLHSIQPDSTAFIDSTIIDFDAVSSMHLIWMILNQSDALSINPSEPSHDLLKVQGNLCPNEPSHELMKAQGNLNPNEPSRALLKALGIRNGSTAFIDSSSSRSSMLSSWMLNPHHMRRNSICYSADDGMYEEGYPVFGYSNSIAKEGSDTNRLYVYSCGIQEESRDMNSLSDPNLNLSENVIILVYLPNPIYHNSGLWYLGCQLFRFFGCNVSGIFRFWMQSFWQLICKLLRNFLLDNYDDIMCKCLWRRSNNLDVCKSWRETNFRRTLLVRMSLW